MMTAIARMTIMPGTSPMVEKTEGMELRVHGKSQLDEHEAGAEKRVRTGRPGQSATWR